MRSLLIEPNQQRVMVLDIPEVSSHARDAIRLALGTIAFDDVMELPNGDRLLADRYGAGTPANFWVSGFSQRPMLGRALIVGPAVGGNYSAAVTDDAFLRGDIVFITRAAMRAHLDRPSAFAGAGR